MAGMLQQFEIPPKDSYSNAVYRIVTVTYKESLYDC